MVIIFSEFGAEEPDALQTDEYCPLLTTGSPVGVSICAVGKIGVSIGAAEEIGSIEGIDGRVGGIGISVSIGTADEFWVSISTVEEIGVSIGTLEELSSLGEVGSEVDAIEEIKASIGAIEFNVAKEICCFIDKEIQRAHNNKSVEKSMSKDFQFIFICFFNITDLEENATSL